MLGWKGEISSGYPRSYTWTTNDGEFKAHLGPLITHWHWALRYHSHGAMDFDAPATLPLRPLFPGAIINGLFWGSLIMLLLWILRRGLGGARRFLRRARSRCPACGYRAGGFDPCPECGRALAAAGA